MKRQSAAKRVKAQAQKKRNSSIANKQILETCTAQNIPDLDIAVLGALELFEKEKVPRLKLTYTHPLVVGSGNAIATGKIIFHNQAAVFADESNFNAKLKANKQCKTIILISASGAKHAPIIAKEAKQKKKQVILLTNSNKAPAREYADETYVFPKNREPYTYNTSTYMGLILAATGESPAAIKKFITTKIDKLKVPDFKNYNRYYILVPEEFEGIIAMLTTKFVELFGRKIARDVFTFEQTKHATTVVPSENELFISFGKKNTAFGKHRLHVPLPKDAGYAAMMAVGYYLIGKIQKAHPPWFKENIEQYCKDASKQFGQNITPIVE